VLLEEEVPELGAVALVPVVVSPVDPVLAPVDPDCELVLLPVVLPVSCAMTGAAAMARIAIEP
jgi:hypothetical protein